MPEIVPGGDFGANIDRKFTERSMVMQAWGSYGTLWPVVHQWLGVSPDAGRGQVSVVPQVPAGQTEVSGRRIRVGDGSVAVHAERNGTRYVTEVVRRGAVGLTIGAVLPPRTPGSAWSASTAATSARGSCRPPVAPRSATGSPPAGATHGWWSTLGDRSEIVVRHPSHRVAPPVAVP